MSHQSGIDGKEPARPRAGLPRHAVPGAGDRDMDRVLVLVARGRRVPLPLLRHRRRCRAPVAEARQIAMYLGHTLLGRTMASVGRYFGRDRTTVSYACGCIEDRRDDMRFDAEVAALEDEVLAAPASPQPVGEGDDHAGH